MNTVTESSPSQTYIKVQKNLQRIVVDEILFLKSNDDHVQVILKNDVILQPRITLKKLLAQLPENLFVQIHRSYAVALAHIDSISTDSIEVNGKQLPIGRLYKAPLKQTLRKVSLQIA